MTVNSIAPRRYYVDASGYRVLVGLGPEETAEFERIEQNPSGATNMRWLELYNKHNAAWISWVRTEANQ